jgi:hypothetical protein
VTLPAQPLGEAGVGSVDVEQPDAALGPEAVPCSRDGGSEHARLCPADGVPGHELDRALEHEEGVHVVGVRVRIDAFEAGGEAQLDHGQLGHDRLDAMLAHLAGRELALAREGDDGLGRREPALLERVEAVEAVGAAAQRVREARAGRVHVEGRCGLAAVVPGRVHEAGRDEHERAGRRAHLRRSVAAHAERELPGEHGERVRATAMDVRLGPALGGLGAGPGDVGELVREGGPDGAPGTIGDRLALAGG